MPKKQRKRKRSVPRTPWHVWFAALLIERGSRNFEIQTEVELLKTMKERLDGFFGKFRAQLEAAIDA